MIKQLTIISTCTNRKKKTTISPILLSNCATNNWETSIEAWIDKVFNPNICLIPAQNLYAGLHWQESLNCLNVADQNKFENELWVMSAGYGLIPGNFPIAPYSSTFAEGSDSIHRLQWPGELDERNRCRIWWTELNARRKTQLPKSLYELLSAKTGDGQLALIICSPAYFFAVEQDLIKLAGITNNFIVFSAGLGGNSCHPALRSNILPIDERFKNISPSLNVPNVALNARLARWLIEEHPELIQSGPEVVIRYFAELSTTLEKVVHKDVNPMSDSEVFDFISKAYTPGDSATKLLRKLRNDCGLSCEQKRFGKLFASFKQTLQTQEEFDGLFS